MATTKEKSSPLGAWHMAVTKEKFSPLGACPMSITYVSQKRATWRMSI